MKTFIIKTYARFLAKSELTLLRRSLDNLTVHINRIDATESRWTGPVALKTEAVNVASLLKIYGNHEDSLQADTLVGRLRGTAAASAAMTGIHDLLRYAPGLYGRSKELPDVPTFISEHELLPSEVVRTFGHSDGYIARDEHDLPTYPHSASVLRIDAILNLFLERFPEEEREDRYIDYLAEVAKLAPEDETAWDHVKYMLPEYGVENVETIVLHWADCPSDLIFIGALETAEAAEGYSIVA